MRGGQEEEHEVPGSQHLPVVPQGAFRSLKPLCGEDNLLSVWCLERENNPASLKLVEIPSRRELASRSRTQA